MSSEFPSVFQGMTFSKFELYRGYNDTTGTLVIEEKIGVDQFLPQFLPPEVLAALNRTGLTYLEAYPEDAAQFAPLAELPEGYEILHDHFGGPVTGVWVTPAEFELIDIDDAVFVEPGEFFAPPGGTYQPQGSIILKRLCTYRRKGLTPVRMPNLENYGFTKRQPFQHQGVNWISYTKGDPGELNLYHYTLAYGGEAYHSSSLFALPYHTNPAQGLTVDLTGFHYNQNSYDLFTSLSKTVPPDAAGNFWGNNCLSNTLYPGATKTSYPGVPGYHYVWWNDIAWSGVPGDAGGPTGGRLNRRIQRYYGERPRGGGGIAPILQTLSLLEQFLPVKLWDCEKEEDE